MVSKINAKNVILGKSLKGTILNAVVILAVTALILIGSIAVAGSVLISSGVFPEGTYVDGIEISNVTYEEGHEIIETNATLRLSALSIELDYAGNIVELSAAELYLDYDTDAVLEQLTYTSEDRSGFPLFKYIGAVFKPKQAGDIEAPLVYDREKTIAALETALSPYDKAPENAQAVFDKSSAKISYSKEVPGRKANASLMAEAVIVHVESGNTSPLTVEYDTIEAEITQADLKDSTALIGECVTQLPDNENGCENIRLASDAVNGTSIMQGETLSLNELLGQRTAEKGYVAAPVIQGTEIVDGIGGGVCQLAGTLYNAALLADLEIVERFCHTYPSTYLPVGLDATINWNDKDLKIKNNSDYAVYISAVMDIDSNTLTVTLYGQALADGVRIEIVPEVIREIVPNGETVEYTKSLPAGQREIVEPAKIGYEVEVYTNYYLDDALTGSELVSHDTYSAKPAIVLVGAGSDNK